MPLLSTGPIEQEPGVNQLRLKALNDTNANQTVVARIFNLDGTKILVATIEFTLAPNSSRFAIVSIPNFAEFEVQFNTSNPDVLVAVFAVNRLTGEFSAANSVRAGEMVTLDSPATT